MFPSRHFPPLVLCAALMLGGCAAATTGHPLGLSAAEWHRMSETEQVAAREKQLEIERREAIRDAEEKHRNTIERDFEQQRLARVYRLNRYGHVVSCRLGGGEARFGANWRALKTQDFRLAIGEVRELTLFRGDGRADFKALWARLGDPATRLDLCAAKPAGADTACQRIEAPARDFRRGWARDVDLPLKIRDARLVCRY